MAEFPDEMNPLDLLRSIEKRAQAAADDMPDDSAQPRRWRGIGFRVGQLRLVTEMGDVGEVLHVPRMSRVPGTKKWVRGLASLRGALLPVVDLGGFLSGENAAKSRESRVLVIHESGVLVGLLVDEVFGLQEFMHDTFEAADEGARDAAVDFTEGCFTNAGEIWQVFNVKTLVSAAEFAQAAA